MTDFKHAYLFIHNNFKTFLTGWNPKIECYSIPGGKVIRNSVQFTILYYLVKDLFNWEFNPQHHIFYQKSRFTPSLDLHLNPTLEKTLHIHAGYVFRAFEDTWGKTPTYLHQQDVIVFLVSFKELEKFLRILQKVCQGLIGSSLYPNPKQPKKVPLLPGTLKELIQNRVSNGLENKLSKNLEKLAIVKYSNISRICLDPLVQSLIQATYLDYVTN